MNEVLLVLGASLAPAVGTFAGGALAERFELTRKQLDLILHFSAGVVLAVVAVELLPHALEAAPAWLITLLFLAGGVVFIAIDQSTHLVAKLLRREDPRAEAGAGPWVLAVAMGFDLFTDALLIGIGAAIEPALGVLLGVGLLAVGAPEAFAIVSVLRHADVPRRARVVVFSAYGLLIPAAALLGFLTRDAPEVVRLGLLAFTAGILATTLVEEIVPQAHAGKEKWQATAMFLAGFAGFAFLTSFVG